VRRKMFQTFMEELRPSPETKILDVGVTSDSFYPESNYFEKMYPYSNQITCVGTEDGSHLMEMFAGLKYFQVTSGQPLPFGSDEFDIVFSNATLEHVGSRTAQASFLQEVCRVGKAFFVTTPSRWFPIEHHTGLPFLHYLPPAIFRSTIRNTRYKYWASESTLNIVTANEIKKLFPEDSRPEVRVIRLLGIGSNLVAFGKTKA
jgi:hypothetical protein